MPLTTQHDQLKKLAPLFDTIRSKTNLKNNHSSLIHIFCDLHQLHCTCKLTGLPVSFVIGEGGYFGFNFTTLN